MAIPVSGLSTGLDTSQLIDKLLAVERRPITLLETRKLKFQALSTVFQDLNARLVSLKSAADALKEPGTFFPRSVSSSAETVATATAAPGSTSGTFTVTVGSLARGSLAAATATKGAFSDVVATASGLFEFRLGTSGTLVSVPVGPGTTLGALATAINDARAGVSASVTNLGTTTTPAYKLLLASSATGSANNIVIVTDGTTLGVTNTQTATDATLTITGLGSVTRPTNTVSDVIEGVTLTVKSTGTTDLSLAIDGAGIRQRLTTVIDAYNDVIRAITTQRRGTPDKDGKPTPGAFTGDVVPRQIARNLGAIIAAERSGTVKALAQVGITTGRDGLLSLDRAQLDRVLADDPAGLSTLIAGTPSTDGIADTLARFLSETTTAVTGAIAARQDGISTSIRRIQAQIDAAQERLVISERTLRAQFNTLEQVIADLQSTGSALLTQLQTLSRLPSGR